MNIPKLDIVVHSSDHGLQNPEGLQIICQGVLVSPEKQNQVGTFIWHKIVMKISNYKTREEQQQRVETIKLKVLLSAMELKKNVSGRD